MDLSKCLGHRVSSTNTMGDPCVTNDDRKDYTVAQHTEEIEKTLLVVPEKKLAAVFISDNGDYDF